MNEDPSARTLNLATSESETLDDMPPSTVDVARAQGGMEMRFGPGTLSHEGGRAGHAACALADGSILVMGGSAFLRWLATVPNWDDGAFAGNLLGVTKIQWNEGGKHGWTAASPMNTTRVKFAAATLLCGTKVAVAGGYCGTTLTEAEVYNAPTDTWSPLPELRVPRDNVCGCVVQAGDLRGCFVVIGGRHNPPNGVTPAGLPTSMFGKTCEYLTRDGSRWLELPPLNISRYGASCVAVGPHIFVVGGFNDEVAAQTSELYDPVRKRWLLLPKQTYTSSFRALVLAD
jgi:hypothetical protein